VPNESFRSLVSEGVPGQEIWTQFAQDMHGKQSATLISKPGANQ